MFRIIYELLGKGGYIIGILGVVSYLDHVSDERKQEQEKADSGTSVGKNQATTTVAVARKKPMVMHGWKRTSF